MPRRISTTTASGGYFTKLSRSARPSTKKRKTPGRVFGTSSQFRGVGVGVKGDPRK